jgi:glycine oxidase
VETPDVLVIGGGIIGCSLARELARANLRVVVVERGAVAGSASSAAAGLLVPFPGAGHAGALVELCRQSAALYPTWIEELRTDGADDVGFRRPGLVEVWRDAGLFERECRQLAGLVRAEVLTAGELRRREPALAKDVVGGVFYPDVAQVDPARLTCAVAGVAERAGVTVRERQPVRWLERGGDRITAVHTAGACYRPGVVVVTAGTWSGGLLEPLGLSLPTPPVKGQMLQADCRVSPVRTPLHLGDALFVPRPDGSLVLGVTIEEAGFDDRVTLDGLRAILERTCAVVPAVGALPLARAWAGLRPATPDGWPYLGPVPPFRNLWLSAGHFRKGILLAPICARLVAASILADRVVDELEPFKPTRRRAC